MTATLPPPTPTSSLDVPPEEVALAPTLGDLRAAHFARSGFSADDYGARWARFPVGPLSFVVPNWPGRGRSLSVHDLHHALTHYDTSLRGEAETAAWELARGCGRHAIAWVLQPQALAFGLFACPRRTWRAFVRGRGGENLYAHPYASEELLARPLSELRRELGLEEGSARQPTWGDRAAFAAISAASLAFALFNLISYLVPLTWALFLVWRLRYDPEARLAEEPLRPR